ncbi:MAG TPA: tetratricopeptide repeat protein [Thermoanaerobaculia bacterium]|nr:tetratricopeptide repeat protein [Thermoanaerobaculia bacterium]
MRPCSLAFTLAFALLVPTSSANVHAQSPPADLDAASYFAIARIHADDGEVQEAIAAFEKALELAPDEPRIHLELADLLLRFRRPEEAAKNAEKALELAPRNPDVLSAYGQIQLARANEGKRDAVAKALAALETLREIAPDDLQGMLMLGQVYQGTGRLDDAVEVYEELVRLNTDNANLKRLLIETLARAGDSERARELLEELERLDQESLEGRLALAEAEAEKGNHGEAIDILEEAGPEDPRVAVLLAREYQRRSQLSSITEKQSRTDLERALELIESVPVDIRAAESVRLHGGILLMLGRDDEAETVVRAAVEAEPNDPALLRSLADLLEARGRGEEAVVVLRRAVVAARLGSPYLPDLKLRLAWALARQQSWAEAAEITGSLLDDVRGPQRDEIFGLHVESLTRAGKAQKALQVLREELERRGPSSQLLLGEAELLHELGRDKEALKVLGRRELAEDDSDPVRFRRASLYLELGQDQAAFALLDASSSDPEGAFRVGRFLTALERFDSSIRYLDRALEGVDDAGGDREADVRFFLGQAYERSGRFEEAAREFREVLEIRADDTTAMNYLGYMWADLGRNLDEALKLVQRAVEMEPSNGAYVDSLGWAYYRLGELGPARESLERAARLNPDNATIHEHLGDVYRALGEIELARSSYERALALEDEDNVAQVRTKLADLQGSDSP